MVTKEAKPRKPRKPRAKKPTTKDEVKIETKAATVVAEVQTTPAEVKVDVVAVVAKPGTTLAEVKVDAAPAVAKVKQLAEVLLPQDVVTHHSCKIVMDLNTNWKLIMCELAPGLYNMQYKPEKGGGGKFEHLQISWPYTHWWFNVFTKNMSCSPYQVWATAAIESWDVKKEKTDLLYLPLPNMGADEASLCMGHSVAPVCKGMTLDNYIVVVMNSILSSTWNDGRPPEFHKIGIKIKSGNTREGMQEWHKMSENNPDLWKDYKLKGFSYIKDYDALLARIRNYNGCYK